MSKSKKTLGLGILLIACFSLLALATDVSGVWEVTTVSQRGDRTSELTIEQDGENIKVTMPGFRGDEMEGTGTVKDKTIEFKFVMETQRGEMTMTYTGTIDGTTMKGEVQFGEMGSAEWSATKK
ncbi:hypothetical protein ACFLT9_01465 [Acidobacteriota bacterium]